MHRFGPVGFRGLSGASLARCPVSVQGRRVRYPPTRPTPSVVRQRWLLSASRARASPVDPVPRRTIRRSRRPSSSSISHTCTRSAMPNRVPRRHRPGTGPDRRVTNYEANIACRGTSFSRCPDEKALLTSWLASNVGTQLAKQPPAWDDQVVVVQTWRAALDEAMSELETVEAHLDVLRSRADALRLTISGLRALLDEGPQERKTLSVDIADAEVRSALMDLPASALRNIEFLRNATQHKTAEGASSTDLAAALLAGVGRPLSMGQIRTLFEYLGWIDPDWKTPGSSIHMAVRRAAEKGLARRLPDNRWVAVAQPKPTKATSTTVHESGGN